MRVIVSENSKLFLHEFLAIRHFSSCLQCSSFHVPTPVLQHPGKSLWTIFSDSRRYLLCVSSADLTALANSSA